MIAEMKKIILKSNILNTQKLETDNENWFGFPRMGNIYTDRAVCLLFLKALG